MKTIYKGQRCCGKQYYQNKKIEKLKKQGNNIIMILKERRNETHFGIFRKTQ